MAPIFAQTAEAAGPMIAMSISIGLVLMAAAIGLSIVGFSYMKALGRNPEAGKSATQIIIIAAMIEVTALLAFLLGALTLL